MVPPIARIPCIVNSTEIKYDVKERWEERETIVLPWPRNDLFPLCPRARNSRRRDKEKCCRCLSPLSQIRSRAALFPLSELRVRLELIEEYVRRPWSHLTDRGGKREERGGRSGCMYEVPRAPRASWEISRARARELAERREGRA